mmetsp:Transcript_19946/g.43499  ORF Transcript_19946/g.43499 Transcript_19946/m.43499 type:complete len:1074 (+) Transcript_19946:85-3306(+)
MAAASLLGGMTQMAVASHARTNMNAPISNTDLEEELNEVKAKLHDTWTQLMFFSEDYRELRKEVQELREWQRKQERNKMWLAAQQEAAASATAHETSKKPGHKKLTSHFRSGTRSKEVGPVSKSDGEQDGNDEVEASQSMSTHLKSDKFADSAVLSNYSSGLINAPMPDKVAPLEPSQIEDLGTAQAVDRPGPEEWLKSLQSLPDRVQLQMLLSTSMRRQVLGRGGEIGAAIGRETGTYLVFSDKIWPGREVHTANMQVLIIEVMTPNGDIPEAGAAVLRKAFNVREDSTQLSITILLHRQLVTWIAGADHERREALQQKTGAKLTFNTAQMEDKAAVPRPWDPKVEDRVEFDISGTLEGIKMVFEDIISRHVELTVAYQKANRGALQTGTRASLHSASGALKITDPDVESAKKESLRREKQVVQSKMKSFGLIEDNFTDTADEHIRLAKRQLRGTWRGSLLTFVTSRTTQAVSYFLIALNLALMWIEVDAETNSDLQNQVRNVQYVLTVIFVIEGLMNLIAIPQAWKVWDVFCDALVVIVAGIIETYTFFSEEAQSSTNWILVLRVVRFYRFCRLIRSYSGARTIRVLIAAFSGAMANLCWIVLFLLVVFYCAAVLFRSMMRGIISDTIVSAVRNGYFETVPNTMLTLIEVFLESFDYSAAITRPLLNSRAYVGVGYIWITYQLLIKLVIANLIAGLFIEQLFKAAGKSDEMAEKQHYASNDVTYTNIERVFSKLVKDDDITLSLNDFMDAVGDEDFESLLQLKQLKVDAQTTFSAMDHSGEGKLTFSDFAYGIVSLRCGSRNIDQLLFDRASQHLIRQTAQTHKAITDTTSMVQHTSSDVINVMDFLQHQKQSQTGKIDHLHSKLNRAIQKIGDVYSGLEITRSEEDRQHSLIKVRNVKDAKSIQEMLVTLRSTIEKASTTAAESTKSFDEDALARLRVNADKEVKDRLATLKEEGEKAAAAASAAARAAAAIAAVAGRGQTLPPWAASQSGASAAGADSEFPSSAAALRARHDAKQEADRMKGAVETHGASAASGAAPGPAPKAKAAAKPAASGSSIPAALSFFGVKGSA